MPARQWPLVIDQGSDYALTIPVFDENEAPITVDDWTASGQIRATASSAEVLAELDVNPSGTNVVLRIPHITSSAWTFRTGRYDVELTSPDGVNVTRILEGLVVVRRETTR